MARRLSARTGRGRFDPIGLRIGLGKKKLAADLTIMPLIINSEYDNFVEISQGRQVRARGRRSPQVAGAVHPGIEPAIRGSFIQGEGLAALAVAGKKFSLGWIGPSISVYADDDPFWDELAKVEPKASSTIS